LINKFNSVVAFLIGCMICFYVIYFVHVNAYGGRGRMGAGRRGKMVLLKYCYVCMFVCFGGRGRVGAGRGKMVLLFI